jgi:neutral ceramidase
MKVAGGQTLSGWAEADITPPLGFPMGGRGPVFDPAERIADPLLAQVCVLQDRSGRRLVLISLDIVGSTPSVADPIRHRLAAIAGTTPEAVVLNYSHTHSSGMGLLEIYPYGGEKPAQIREYEARLSKTLSALTYEALDRLLPADVFWRNGKSDLAINRRRRNDGGLTEHRPNREGYYDPNLWVLELMGSAGRAILYSYACHPVVLYGAEWQTISADFPGRTRLTLKGRLGEATHVQFLQGLAGSVRPRILADLDREEFVLGSRETLERTGEELADDLMETLASAPHEIEADLHAVTAYAPIRPGAPLDPDSVRAMGEAWGGADVYWRERLRNGPPCDLVQPWLLGLVQLDRSHLIAYLASEAVAEWRPLIEELLSSYELACWAYCQHGHTYLPTDELIAEGGYEVDQAPLCTNFWPQPMGLGTDDLIMTGFARLRERLERERD